MDNRKAWLQKLHEDPLFKQYIIKELEAKRPSIPNWNPNEDNTEKWKEKSAQQNGFDMALIVLGIKAK